MVVRYTPNTLTCVRILLALIFPFVSVHYRVPIVILALLTEYLDGAISRFFGVTSRLGQLLDPIADKLFFVAVAFVFIREGNISVGEFALLGFRDLCVLGAVIWTLAHKRYSLMRTLKPVFIGKVATVLQYFVSFDVLLTGGLNRALLSVTAAVSLMAAVQYAAAFRKTWDRR